MPPLRLRSIAQLNRKETVALVLYVSNLCPCINQHHVIYNHWHKWDALDPRERTDTQLLDYLSAVYSEDELPESGFPDHDDCWAFDGHFWALATRRRG